MKKIIISFLALFFFSSSQAQELNCNVSVLSDPGLQINATDKQVFEDLKTAVFEFMNSTQWTQDVFKVEERIDCSIMIQISKKLSSDQFSGSIQIQSSRAVYNSTYKSNLFRYNDTDFEFRYMRNTPVIFTPDQHQSNLASALAFYAYIIIGYDYDSQEHEGGTKYFVKAQQIVSNAQSAVERGWKAHESNKNRYWLVDNILHQVFQPLRKCVYEYHRLGFDNMYNNIDKGRLKALESIELLKKVHQNRPGSFNLQLFLSAKVDEVVELFGGASGNEKGRAVNVLKLIDPANASRYDRIMKKK